MFLLEWLEGDKIQYIGIFDSVESGRDFMQKVPGYRYEIVEEDGFSFDEEIIEYSKLPDIIMIEHNGYQVPVSRFSFEDDIMVIWVELDHLDIKRGSNRDSSSFTETDPSAASDILTASKASKPVIASGATRVDAYSIGNEDVEEYVTRREEKYRTCVSLFEEKGYEATRGGFGSEDGEYILVRKKSKKTEKTEKSEKFKSSINFENSENSEHAKNCVHSEHSFSDWRFFTHMDPSFLEMDIEAEICEFLKEIEG